MQISDAQMAAAIRLAVAALIGLGVGLEREWSGHTTGPAARFAGIRTFLLLGLIGGSAGLLLHEGNELVATAIVAGAAVFVTAAFVMVLIQNPAERDGTTEVAAMLVVVLGVISTAVSWGLAAGAGSVVVLALNEKKRLHGAVRRVQEEELRAALRFSVLALVILPILPEGPFFGWADFRPRMLWMIVLLFCAINFAGFLARKTAGESRGYLLTGLLGGVISSTAVTLGFARFSRQYPTVAAGLATGVVGACTVLVPRVFVISTAINPEVGLRLVPLLLPAGILGGAVVALAWFYGERWEPAPAVAPPAGWLAPDERSPLRFWFAIRLAIVFQLAIMAITFVRSIWAVEGLYATSVVLGLTDVDALTVSMSTPSASILPTIAARAIATGILANTVVKFSISAVVGSGRFRLMACSILFAMAAAIGAALFFL